MEEMHSAQGGQMIKSAEGCAGPCTKSRSQHHGGAEHRSWRKKKRMRGMLDHCEAKRNEWSKHGQCDEEVQNMKDKPWKNEELRRWKEALPRLKECDLEEASRMYKAKTGVGCDGFHPKIPIGLDKWNKRISCGILRAGGAEWQNGRNKPALRCSS